MGQPERERNFGLEGGGFFQGNTGEVRRGGAEGELRLQCCDLFRATRERSGGRLNKDTSRASRAANPLGQHRGSAGQAEWEHELGLEGGDFFRATRRSFGRRRSGNSS
jgi:hypothetical protein